MTNEEKDNLRSLVKFEISRGLDKKKAVAVIKRLGFKPATIGKYYETFSR